MAGDDVNLRTEDNEYFTLKEKIGSGAFSGVYLGKDKRTSKDVAIKIFKMEHYKFNSSVSQIAMEMSIMLIMDHPNIMKIIMCDIGKPYTFVGMNYSKIGGLEKLIRPNNGLSEIYVKNIMKQIIAGVNYLHHLHVFHGDIKPANIIVFEKEPNLHIQLSDFGLSEIIMEKQKEEPKKAGSLFYMAPELLLKFPYNLSADIFSVGIVMYQMLFGIIPFNNVTKTTHTTFLRKRLPILKPVALLGKPMSTDCFDFLRRLLDYDQKKRLIGSALTNHPFINGGSSRNVTDNLYIKACNSITKSFALINTRNYGRAYIQITEGIVLLKIHSVQIQEDDPDMCAYMKHRIALYTSYARNLEISMLYKNNHIIFNFNMNDDSLRCMLTSTPLLLTGYDLCIVGHMYVNQNKVDIGRIKLESGLEVCIKHLRAEPTGVRRNLLYSKVTEWMQLLDRIKSRAPTAPISPK